MLWHINGPPPYSAKILGKRKMNLSMVMLITGSGFLASIGLWLGLIYWNKSSKISTRQLFIVIIIVGFVCRIAFLFFTPTFYAPDEQSHFNYVKYLAENRALPIQTSRTDSLTNDWEYYQPPIYYLSLSPIYLLSENLFKDTFITVRILRAFSIIFWGITILFTYKFLNHLNVHDVFMKTFVFSMISLLPTYTFLSSVINNDNLLIAIGSGILCLTIQKTSLKNSMLIGLLLGLALLSKLTAVVYIAFIIFILLIGIIKKTAGQIAIHHVVLQIAIAAFIWGPWAWRNNHLYGSITAEEVANIPMHWPTAHYAVVSTLQYMQSSFWAVSGIYNNISFFFPAIGALIFCFACIGPLFGRISKREKLALLIPKDSTIIFALGLTIVVNAILVFRFGVLYGQGQGRFLFPLLIPISLLLAIGLRVFPISDRQNAPIHLVIFFSTYALSFMLFSLTMFSHI